MKTVQSRIKVGFWYSKFEPEYPMPVARSKPFPDKEQILRNLTQVEAQAEKLHYRGSSIWRLCDLKRNGAFSFRLKGFEWPVGYRHYLEEHNVAPDPAFVRHFKLDAANE